MAKEEATVNAAELSAFLNVDASYVTRLHSDHGMPRKARGKYDLHECAKWYIRHLQERARSRAFGANDATREQKARLAGAEATLKELEVARLRRELIPVEDAVRLWDDALARVRDAMIATVSTSAQRVIGVRTLPQAHALIEGVIHDALSAAAETSNATRKPAPNGRGSGAR